MLRRSSVLLGSVGWVLGSVGWVLVLQLVEDELMLVTSSPYMEDGRISLL